MKFLTRITSAVEVLFVGHERGNSRSADAWLSTGRWKISMSAIDLYLNEKLDGVSFGTSIERFVFCFEIADFDRWGEFFRASAEYTSYRPKTMEIWSVGQLRWSDVKDLQASDQMIALRGVLQTAIQRIGRKRRKPRDFAYMDFASAVDGLLEQAPVEALLARPAV